MSPEEAAALYQREKAKRHPSQTMPTELVHETTRGVQCPKCGSFAVALIRGRGGHQGFRKSKTARAAYCECGHHWHTRAREALATAWRQVEVRG